MTELNFIILWKVLEAPEPEVDHRPLYDRLKCEREKVEAEKAEARSLSEYLLVKILC